MLTANCVQYLLAMSDKRNAKKQRYGKQKGARRSNKWGLDRNIVLGLRSPLTLAGEYKRLGQLSTEDGGGRGNVRRVDLLSSGS